MSRAPLSLGGAAGQAAVYGQWKFARVYVPGQPNEGLLKQAQGSPARLADYDDSGWEVCTDLTQRVSHGFSFMWYPSTSLCPKRWKGIRSMVCECSLRPALTTMGRSGWTANATGSVEPYRVSTCPKGSWSLTTPSQADNTPSLYWQSTVPWDPLAAAFSCVTPPWLSSGPGHNSNGPRPSAFTSCPGWVCIPIDQLSSDLNGQNGRALSCISPTPTA